MNCIIKQILYDDEERSTDSKSNTIKNTMGKMLNESDVMRRLTECSKKLKQQETKYQVKIKYCTKEWKLGKGV